MKRKPPNQTLSTKAGELQEADGTPGLHEAIELDDLSFVELVLADDFKGVPTLAFGVVVETLSGQLQAYRHPSSLWRHPIRCPGATFAKTGAS
jgi:hypothetical protein